MRSFRRTLNNLQLEKMHLTGRLYTWSNHRPNPTLERIDRVFASVQWMEDHSNHLLRCLSSDCSDHSPFLLITNTHPWAKPRFQFETIWTRYDGFAETVKEAWEQPMQQSDACRTMDSKLRSVAKALKSWSSKHVGTEYACSWLLLG